MRNLPKVRVTIGQKPKTFYPDYFHHRMSSSNQTLQNTDEMKLLMKFYLCLHNFAELLKLIIFSSSYGDILGSYLYLLLLGNVKKGFNIHKTIR